MNFLGNLLWIVLGGGIFIALEYLITGIFVCLTIFGIPFGYQGIKLGFVALFPFGTRIKQHDTSGSTLIFVMNIIWILFGGFVITLTHLFFAGLCFITVIGIPFAKQHMKLAKLAFMPFGKEVL